MYSPPDRRGRWYAAIGLFLMLPIGIIVLLVLLYTDEFHGAYVPGTFLFLALALFLTLFAVRLLFRASRRQYYRQRRTDNAPTRILRQRYARGEISRQEYESMLRDLQQRHSPPGPR